MKNYKIIEVKESIFKQNDQDANLLRKKLKEERRRKQLNLMAKVFKIVGVIQDASHLTLDERGDLNGIVYGTEGKCKVTTIGAGGYNIQCYHLRMLVKEL